MKLLAIVSGILTLMLTAGAVVLVQQGDYDIASVMGWRTEPAADGANQPATATDQSANQPDGQSAGGATSASADAEPARQSGDAASAKADAVETAVAALGDLNLSAAKKPDSSNRRSTFDVARINPDGVSVFAGQGKPFQFVSVLADGIRLGTAKVDENGEWVLVTEKKLASADPELSIEVGSALTDFEDMVEDDTVTSGPGEASADANEPEAGSGTRVAALSGSAKQNELTPTVREINERMLDDLQKMVDGAARDETATESAEPAFPEAADKSAAEEPAADGKSAPGEPGRVSTPSSSAAAGDPRTENQDGPRKVAAAATSPVPRAANDVKTVPIPVQFVYREATFTEDGEKAASLLLQYVKLGKLPMVTLSGHADERGSPSWNMQLSKDRLDAVEEYLRAGGYKGRLILLPKGETEPYEGVDRASLAAEDLFQLDRRVELHLDQ